LFALLVVDGKRSNNNNNNRNTRMTSSEAFDRWWENNTVWRHPYRTETPPATQLAGDAQATQRWLAAGRRYEQAKEAVVLQYSRLGAGKKRRRRRIRPDAV